MIIGHETRKIDGKDTLLLYLDFSLETGSFDINKKENLIDIVKNYLNKIKSGSGYKKILLMSSGIIIATILFIGNDIKIVSNENLNTEPIIIDKINAQSIPFLDVNNIDDLQVPENKAEQNLVDESFKEESFSENKSEVQTPSTEETFNKDNLVNNNINKVLGETSNTDNKSQNIESENNVQIKDNNSKENSTDNRDNSTETEQLVTVYRSNGEVVQLQLEEYLVGVLSAEMPASFSVEALKAQAVVARTYTLKRISTGQKLTDTVSTQAYIDVNQMKQKWGSEISKYYNKIKNAVEETKGEYITYNGDYINAVYHSTSNGYTENAENVWKESYPYLKSVDSSWDKKVNSYERTITKDYNNLLDVTGLNDETLEINILSRNKSGRVEFIKVGDKIYTGVEFRNLLGLRSADFDIEVVDDTVQITTRGYGHGVGMSQYGANEMSKQGYNYRQIINHYYTNVQIEK